MAKDSTIRLAVLPLLGSIILAMGCTARNAPQNYEDCVLEYIKPGLSDRGALLVADACQKKFSEPAKAFDLHPLDE